MEARGLDVTPGMIARLRDAGDERTAGLLEIILRDEIGHVAVGSRWFRHACEERGLEPEAVFRDLVRDYLNGGLRGPFNLEARCRAGFTPDELDRLAAITEDGEP
jgi:uncharacterized ferritin-like protein (DUF455 family)